MSFHEISANLSQISIILNKRPNSVVHLNARLLHAWENFALNISIGERKVLTRSFQNFSFNASQKEC